MPPAPRHCQNSSDRPQTPVANWVPAPSMSTIKHSRYSRRQAAAVATELSLSIVDPGTVRPFLPIPALDFLRRHCHQPAAVLNPAAVKTIRLESPPDVHADDRPVPVPAEVPANQAAKTSSDSGHAPQQPESARLYSAVIPSTARAAPKKPSETETNDKDKLDADSTNRTNR